MLRGKFSGEKRHLIHYWPGSWFVQAFRYISYGTGFMGFLSLFLNFHSLIGIIFLISSVIVMAIAVSAENYKSRQIRQSSAADEQSTSMD